jgi:mannose PTS system EIIA component
MANILVISHGQLAKELCNTAALIMGPITSLDFISMDVVEGVEKLKNDLNGKICELLQTSDKLLIVSDLYSGCPFITASKCAADVHPPQQCKIITGANLPMLLELCLANNSAPDDLNYLVEVALNAGKEGISEFVLQTQKKSSDEIM